VTIIRDTILGVHDDEKGTRPGMVFDANGMHIVDVDVLGFEIPDREVAQSLLAAQRDALTTSLRIQNKEREVEQTKRAEALDQTLALTKAETYSLRTEVLLKQVEEDASVATKRQEVAQAELSHKQELTKIEEATRGSQARCRGCARRCRRRSRAGACN